MFSGVVYLLSGSVLTSFLVFVFGFFGLFGWVFVCGFACLTAYCLVPPGLLELDIKLLLGFQGVNFT